VVYEAYLGNLRYTWEEIKLEKQINIKIE